MIASQNHVSTVETCTNRANVKLKTNLAINVTKLGYLPINVDHPTGHKVLGQQTQRFLQRKPATTVIPQQSPRAALSMSESIHLMSAKGCIGVTEFGTFDDNIDSKSWLTSIDVTYNLPTN